MTNKVWLLCVALIFGFVLLRSDSSEGRPLDFSPIEYQRKTRAEAEFMAKRLNAASEDRPPYIPPIEFGRKKEVIRGFMGKVANQPPYIPPIEFGRKRDGSNTLEGLGNGGCKVHHKPSCCAQKETIRSRDVQSCYGELNVCQPNPSCS